MTQQASDMTKTVALQMAHQPSQSDPNVDMILQSLMIDDTDLKRVLKGEIQEPLNRLRETVEQLSQTVIDCSRDRLIDTGQAKELLSAVRETNPLMVQIEQRLTRYYHMVPYLLWLSPLTRLSNLTPQMAEAAKRKVSIMIGRDKLMASGEDDNFENANFWDSLEFACHVAIQDSIGGWKMQGVVTERRQVSTVIEDRTGGGGRKRKFGIF